MSSRFAHVHFSGLAAGGEAVGRDETGKAIFAPFAAPGDVATVAIKGEKKSFARGLIHHLEQLSPDRITPLCPQFRPDNPPHSCGGCAWQHLSIEAQRSAKREVVAAALSRLGEQNVEVEACRGGAAFGYRNKADFVIETEASGGEIGFFARESHDLVAASVCPIQVSQNEAILQIAREILRQNPRLAFDSASGRGALRRLVARTSSSGESLVTLVPHENAGDWSQADWSQIAALLREAVPHLCGVLLRLKNGATKKIWGLDFLVETVNDLRFRVRGEGFWQVNPEMTPLLASLALELAPVAAGQRVLDLFCGAGLFALHFARAGAKVTGVEFSRSAIEDARFNASQNGLKIRFSAGDATRELRKFKSGEFDLIILDPPRAGAASCLEELLRLNAPRLLYVSCDPATLARDAKVLGSGGYNLKRAIPFDLFPQTAHVETVTLFERA